MCLTGGGGLSHRQLSRCASMMEPRMAMKLTKRAMVVMHTATCFRPLLMNMACATPTTIMSSA